MQISEGMKNSRGDNTAGLKSVIKNYLSAEPMEPLPGPPLPDGKKSLRGFNHPVTAKLLCPLKYPATQECVFMIEHSPYLTYVSQNLQRNQGRSKTSNSRPPPSLSLPRKSGV